MPPCVTQVPGYQCSASTGSTEWGVQQLFLLSSDIMLNTSPQTPPCLRSDVVRSLKFVQKQIENPGLKSSSLSLCLAWSFLFIWLLKPELYRGERRGNLTEVKSSSIVSSVFNQLNKVNRMVYRRHCLMIPIETVELVPSPNSWL